MRRSPAGALRKLDWWTIGFVLAVAVALAVAGHLLHDWWPVLPGAVVAVLYLGATVAYGRHHHHHPGDMPRVSATAPRFAGSEPMVDPLAIRLLADAPTDLRDVPLLDDGAQLWCGRLHREGRQELWQISSRHSATTIVCYRRDADVQHWERSHQSAVGLDLPGALHQLTNLLELSTDVITRFAIGQDGPKPEILLEALSVVEDRSPATERPDSIGVPWEEDVDIDDFFPDIEWRHVWAMIDELRVTALRAEIDGLQMLVPVLIDLDPGDAPEWHAIEVITEDSWVNDDSGVPVIWSGSNSVLRVNCRLAVEVQRGDNGREDHLVVLAADQRGDCL